MSRANKPPVVHETFRFSTYAKPECPLHPEGKVVRIQGHDVCEECYGKPLHNRAVRRRSMRMR